MTWKCKQQREEIALFSGNFPNYTNIYLQMVEPSGLLLRQVLMRMFPWSFSNRLITLMNSKDDGDWQLAVRCAVFGIGGVLFVGRWSDAVLEAGWFSLSNWCKFVVKTVPEWPFIGFISFDRQCVRSLRLRAINHQPRQLINNNNIPIIFNTSIFNSAQSS